MVNEFADLSFLVAPKTLAKLLGVVPAVLCDFTFGFVFGA